MGRGAIIDDACKILWISLEKTGSFRQCVSASEEFDAGELELLELKKHGRFKDFLRLAVQLKKNILVSGSTGTGKTTMTNGLLLEIPETERLITIEDAPELVLKKQPNHVRLFYSKGDQGLAKVTPKLLLESCLRMRPDRVFLSELRSDEAYDYLKVIVAHPGSITSIHASTARLALKQLMMYVKQSGAGLTTDDVRELTYMLVDVVMQFGHDGGHRIVKELWYEPDKKRQTAR